MTESPPEELTALAEAARALGEVDGGRAADPVNAPAARHWLHAMGDANPRYLEAGEAPPAMLQVWTMRGLDPEPPGTGSAVDGLLEWFDANGCTGVVATDCAQTYHRPLRFGEELRSTTRFGSLSGPKRTAMGTGYFLTWHTCWYSGEEQVGEMMFRVLKFAPPESPPQRPARPERHPLRPARSADTDFFWDGTARGELRIRRCTGCGALRHPPGPLCPHCRSAGADHVTASGAGTVYSYTVHHHPPVPGRTAPFAVAVVELPEGVRVTGGIVGADPAEVHVGMPVRLEFERVDSDLVLPQWRPGTGEPLPALHLPLTRSSITAQALATRDFQNVHHDPGAARAQGAADVFMNILTTQGLVQRYATDWAGPAARVRRIAIRLGAPNHAGDSMLLTGTAERSGTATEISVRGTNSLGPHVTGTVTVEEGEG
ncbi:OB-fold domain-containing protein [Nocardiopsis potens]|uniref:OB-fold domain-containing protein n=1 Tax=Nocardiopsis potens TaxID=1246458 RepID=UPI0003453E64|nr:OB-fold domain-containing protein [Nocardiopsis potens]